MRFSARKLMFTVKSKIKSKIDIFRSKIDQKKRNISAKNPQKNYYRTVQKREIKTKEYEEIGDFSWKIDFLGIKIQFLEGK